MLIFLFQINNAFTQKVITGIVQDSMMNNIELVNVSIRKSPNAGIIAYTTTNKEGAYYMPFDLKLDTLYLCFNHIAYFKNCVLIENKSQEINMRLGEKSNILEPIQITTSAPVERSGDTLKFNIKDYIVKEGESLETILKRMPGIEIKEDGKILYQDMDLSNFYIEGLNMMGGQYGVVTKNLNTSIIEQVHIIERHQHIKALDSIYKPPNAAMNLKLKAHSVAITTQNTASLGMSPLLYNAQSNGFVFHKKMQLNFNFNANNIGIGNQYFTQNFFAEAKPSPLILSVTNIDSRLLPKDFVFGNSKILTLNSIKKISENNNLMLQASYTINQEEKWLVRKTNYIIGDNTLTLQENIFDILKNNLLKTTLNFEHNSKNMFFTNNTDLSFGKTRDQADFIYNDVKSKENFTNNPITFTTKQAFILSHNKKAYSINTDIDYSKDNGSLGLNNLIFPFDLPNQFSKKALQSLYNENLQSSIYTNFRTKIKSLQSNYELGYRYKYLNLKSNLSAIFQNDLEYRSLGEKFDNDFKINIVGPYLNTKIDFEAWGLFVYIKNELAYNTITKNNNENNSNKNLFSGFVLDPSIRIQKDIKNITTNIKYGYFNGFAGVESIYDDVILLTNRNFNIGLNQPILNKSQNLSYNFQYRDGVKGRDITLQLSYKKSETNILQNNSISVGSVLSQVNNANNISNNYSANLTLQRYFVPIRSYLGLRSFLNFQNANQIVNGTISNFDLSISSIVPYIQYKYKRLGFQAEYGLATSNNRNNSFKTILPSLVGTIEIGENGILSYDYRTYVLQSTENQLTHFINLYYKHNINKKISLKLNMTNLLNETSFITGNKFLFSENISTLRLRPRQVYLDVHFKL